MCGGAERRAMEVEFTVLLAHDLQAPLRTIVSFSEIMLRDPGQTEMCLERIKFAVCQIQEYISDLEIYAKSGMNDNGFMRDVDLNEVIKSVLGIIAIELCETEVIVGELPVVTGNQAQLMRVFQNLLENSIRYCDGSRALVIEIKASRKENGWWQVFVRDNGKGFKQELAEDVFIPFKRLYSWDEVHGTGLGLTIVKRVIDAHCGKVWAESEPGVGTTINLLLRGVEDG